MTIEQRRESKRERKPHGYMGDNIPGRGNSRCKDLELGHACVKKSKGADVPGGPQAGERVEGAATLRRGEDGDPAFAEPCLPA